MVVAPRRQDSGNDRCALMDPSNPENFTQMSSPPSALSRPTRLVLVLVPRQIHARLARKTIWSKWSARRQEDLTCQETVLQSVMKKIVFGYRWLCISREGQHGPSGRRVQHHFVILRPRSSRWIWRKCRRVAQHHYQEVGGAGA